jgi:DNA-directed RNA polymerase subunit RPC12/RpoP
MATYRTTKCPFCAYEFESRSPFAEEKVGHPRIECPECHHTVLTGKKYWMSMGFIEKANYILWKIIGIPATLILNLAIFVGTPVLVDLLFNDGDLFPDIDDKSWITILAVASSVILVLHLLSTIKLIRLKPE